MYGGNIAVDDMLTFKYEVWLVLYAYNNFVSDGSSICNSYLLTVNCHGRYTGIYDYTGGILA